MVFFINNIGWIAPIVNREEKSLAAIICNNTSMNEKKKSL
jgi:hypothetical protein